MRPQFDNDGNPDLRVVVAEYRDAVRKRMRWIGPGLFALVVLIILLTGVYSVDPGEVAVVRTFGKETAQVQPGLHFIFPIAQQKDIVDLAKVRRAEIGFRNTEAGPKRVDSEALMLTGDENIIEAQMIVQYQVEDPSKYLFALKDPETTLHIAAEVALRGVVGQMRITSSIEELVPTSNPGAQPGSVPVRPPQGSPEANDGEKDEVDGADSEDEDAEGKDADGKDAEGKDAEDKDAEGEDADTDTGVAPQQRAQEGIPGIAGEASDPETDILTKGRERAQVRTKELLQELMNLYESGLKITEVKLQVVDAPDEVKDAFHDVVRAREKREELINKALGDREDRLPRARGEAQKILRAAEAYKQERVLRSEGEAARFNSILAEYRKARGVTRQRLHLETMERILSRAPNKVLIDKDVANNALPLLPLSPNALPKGGAQ